MQSTNAEDDVYADLPDDPEEAFLILEKVFLDDCDRALNFLPENVSATHIYVKYISRVLGAVEALDLKGRFSNRALPTIEDIDYNTYLDFSKEIEHYKTTLKIRTSRRRREYSVAFDSVTKAKLSHLLSNMKKIVQKLEVPEAKREALFARISDLESEINRNRTRLEALAALWVESCGKIGEGFEKLEPLRRMLDSIGSIVGDAKSQERNSARQLPPPPKRIEPPRDSSSVNDDNDLPF